MAYRYGNRGQVDLLPPCIEDYISSDNPVRVYDAMIDALDMQKLGIKIDTRQVGNPEYDPRTMLKLLVYGYSYGIKSSRKLERECHHNISFIWLMGGLKPDHKTIAEFRRHNKPALKQVLKQCVRMCIKLDMIDGNVLFVDGSKIRANANREKHHDQEYYEKRLMVLDRRISELLSECDKVDDDESDQRSYVQISKELKEAGNLKGRIEEVLKSFESSDRKKINLTDPDCALMRSVQGSHASYNVQGVVDDKHGLIVHAEAIDKSDIKELPNQISQANENLGKTCDVACADAGYSDSKALEKVKEKEIKVVVPSQRQALHKEEGPFSKSHFKYDKGQDCYTCPEGHKLRYQSTVKKNGKRYYCMVDKTNCSQCQHYGTCTSSKRGRKIMRLPNENAKEHFEELYEQNRELYARRKSRSEHPFGHIKRNLKTDSFHLRGKDGVQAETSILATCFNMVRMTKILGVGVLLAKLMEMSPIPS